MKFNVTKGKIESFKADVICIGCFEVEPKKGAKERPASLLKEDGGPAVDRALKGQISKLITAEEFTGAEGRNKVLFTAGAIPARYVMLTGLGRKKAFTPDVLRRVASSIAKAANDVKAASVAMVFQKEPFGEFKTAVRMRAAVEGMLLGIYSFDKYKNEEDRKKTTLKNVSFIITSGNPAQFDTSIKTGASVANAANIARDLSNAPGSDMTPSLLAKYAKEIASRYRLDFKLMGSAEIKAEKMGAFLAIAKGSEEPPVFIQMNYRPAKKARARIAVIGKGITFDAGGISLKPPKGMEQMKNDMAGAAAAIAIMQGVAELKPNVAVDAYIPACENMPSGRALKPGDIVRTRNGKTIEIITTDAEGRIIMADAVSYAAEKKYDYIIDIATLTGACVYAVGEKYIAILGSDQRLIDRIKKSGEDAGEFFWQLPLEEDYKRGLTKGIADLKNTGASKADTITGALFLKEFVGDAKWAHLDIASTSWTDEELPYTPRGSTGAGVRALLYFLMSF